MIAGQPTVNIVYIIARLACILTTMFHGHKEMKRSIAEIMRHDDGAKQTDISFTEPYFYVLAPSSGL